MSIYSLLAQMKFLQKKKKEKEGGYSWTKNYWFLPFSLILCLSFPCSSEPTSWSFLIPQFRMHLRLSYLKWFYVFSFFHGLEFHHTVYGVTCMLATTPLFFFFVAPKLSFVGSAFLWVDYALMFITVGYLVPSLCLISYCSCTCISLDSILYLYFLKTQRRLVFLWTMSLCQVKSTLFCIDCLLQLFI